MADHNDHARPLWTPDSWRAFPIGQPVSYPQQQAPEEGKPVPDPATWKRKQSLEEVVEQLGELPPLVSAVEVSWSGCGAGPPLGWSAGRAG